MQETKWAPTVVLVDADYLDTLALDLIENFGRMLNRRIPSADLCHWVDCVLLDGGLRPGKNEVQVHFYIPKKRLHYNTFSHRALLTILMAYHLTTI